MTGHQRNIRVREILRLSYVVLWIAIGIGLGVRALGDIAGFVVGSFFGGLCALVTSRFIWRGKPQELRLITTKEGNKTQKVIAEVIVGAVLGASIGVLHWILGEFKAAEAGQIFILAFVGAILYPLLPDLRQWFGLP